MPMTPTAPPVADWVDPEQLVADPYPTYARLHAEAPVAWVPALESYVVTGFDACRQIELTPDVFTAVVDVSLMTRVMGSPTMIAQDDPGHARERAPVNPAMRPRAMKEIWAAAFERNARHYLDVLAEAGPDAADLNRDFAAPLATKNLMDVVGISGVEVETVRHWSEMLILGLGNFQQDPDVWATVDPVVAQMRAHLLADIPRLREHPEPTFGSALVSAGLSDDEVAANIMLAISGGMNEPQHMVTAITWALTEHPEQRAEVLAEPDLWPAVFDETLRWLSPIGVIPRKTLVETELDGAILPAGADVTVVIAAGNRDERHFAGAGRFDIHRDDRSHLAFGAGAHMCAGMWAANWSIGRIAVPMLFRRFPGLRTAPDRSSRWFGFIFRGLAEHPVTWDADEGVA